VRLGDGTDESHRRAQAALDYLLPYTREFFSIDPVEQNIADAGIGPLTADLRAAWLASLDAALAEATLQAPHGAAPAAAIAAAVSAGAASVTTIGATSSAGGSANAGNASPGAAPAVQGYVSTGKFGAHSEHLGFLLAEMQSLARAHPGATW
jgi:ring-1,2-phenylacetyl-CoA epoxidase subunit PaaC